MQARPGDLSLTIRTTRTTVSFINPFTLRSLEGFQPAGEYAVVIDDEQIEGLSRIAYRRAATLFQTRAGGHCGTLSTPSGCRRRRGPREEFTTRCGDSDLGNGDIYSLTK
jgi:hypothetical protein